MRRELAEMDDLETSDSFEVSTGCRLHFGLMELMENQPSRFGGLGLMLPEPGWRLRFSVATANRVEADLPEVVERVQRLLDLQSQQTNRFAAVKVCQSLRMHSGLGAGTQLACAVAVGAAKVSGTLPKSMDLPWLRAASGRGKRSAIGMFGFLFGGLVSDSGRVSQLSDAATSNSKQDCDRVVFSRPLCTNWHVVLLMPDNPLPIFGQTESEMLSVAAAKPNPHRQAMIELAAQAAQLCQQAENFEAFTSCLQEYLELAGRVFAECQGGLYNGRPVTAAVEAARRAGLRAVGQSSWGPTVFGFACNEREALNAADRIRAAHGRQGWSIVVTRAANTSINESIPNA